MLLLANLALWFISLSYVFIIFLSFSLVFLALVVFFFRFPERKVEEDNNIIISPAEGTIVAIEEVDETSYFNKKMLQLSIFMSPLDIHANHCPVSGELVYKKHEPGKYWVAYNPKSSVENERTSIVIRTADGIEIMTRQIAGAVARRIVTYPNINDRCRQGDNFGFIKFGSRVDIFLPVDTSLLVDLHQKVKANITQLARLI